MFIKKFKLYTSIALLLSSSAFAKESIEWSYNGLNGPDKWGKLDKEFMSCGEGIMQSPIDISKKNLISNKSPIIFDYAKYGLLENKHGMKYLTRTKNIKIDNVTYDLSQFHFHAPSEHSIDKQIFPAELHFVHHDKDGNLAVIGVFFKEGKSNPAFSSLVSSVNESKQRRLELESEDLMFLLPENKEYFHYMGSLTTPPCTEGVNWYVLKHPVEASKEELLALDSSMADNARPVQNAAGRVAK